MNKKTIHRKARGVVILFALFFLMILALLGSALIQLVPQEMVYAGRDRTDTSAHYACTSGLKLASTWIVAVQAAGTGSTPYNNLGDNWNTGTVTYGSLTYNRKAFDPFSMPTTDPNFVNTTVAGARATLPVGYQVGTDSMSMFGLTSGKNLISTDYTAMAADAANWPCLRTRNPLLVGGAEVYTFIIPDTQTKLDLPSPAISTRRSYLLISLAYIQGVPFLRARAVMQETTYAKYAWFIDKWSTDGAGVPNTRINVSGANTVIADGPFHTNQSPVLDVDASYWDTPSTTGKHAFEGVVTFAGNASVQATMLSPDHDNGIAWFGGNFQGTGTAKRPSDIAGAPQPLAPGPGNRYARN